MPNIGQMIESKYLKQSDLDGEVEVTIVKVGQLNVAREDQEPEMKWAIRFQELQKPMVLNSTNIQLLAKACGSEESDDWVGKKVVIYADPNVSFGGKLVGGLRVKLPVVKKAQKPNGGGKFDDLEDDVPFVSCALGSDVIFLIFRKLRWGNE
jgi:hypothetical protein